MEIDYMVSTLAMWLVLVAPVAAQAASVAAESPPRLMQLKADASGKVLVAVIVDWQTRKIGAEGNRDGTSVPVTASGPIHRNFELGELNGLVISTAAGAKVSLLEARQKLAMGAVVLVSSDGKPVSAEYLKVFKADTLVLVAAELIDAPISGAFGAAPR